MARAAQIRMLYWTREEFPALRVDIDVLFGVELLGRGHAIDFVMQAGSAQVLPGSYSWCGRTVFMGAPASGSAISPFVKHLRTFWHDLRSLRLARREHYDAIQFRDKFLIAAIAVVVARIRGLKFFYWLSYPYPEDDRLRARSGLTRFPLLVNLRGIISAWLLYRWILPHSDHAFVQSERMKSDIAAHGISLQKMTAVPMGIDLIDIPTTQQGAAAAVNGNVVLGYLGALNADRHIEMLVDMLAELRAARAAVRLLLIGDALNRADHEALLQRARQLGVLEHLEITGTLPRLQALQRMQGVHIALSPYYPDPILLSTSPTKLVEYLALGLPVVASEHPEQRSILRESGAGICAPWGARHFARSVRWLLRHSPAHLASMGLKGRKWVQENRTYSHIADDLERKYLELLPDAVPPQIRPMALRREMTDG